MAPPASAGYRLLCVGRARKDAFTAAFDEYLRRLNHALPCTVHWLRDNSALAARLEKEPYPIFLDEHGQSLTSVAMAQALAALREGGQRTVSFVVGGADGLPVNLRPKARAVWSLSALTLPHRLAQVLLVEQLYRAHSLLQGSPYHRA